MTSLLLSGVTITLVGPTRPLISGLTVAARPGEIVTIMGGSGAGKSTLLAFIGGHLDYAFRAEGRVRIGDRDVTDVPAEKRRIGILFQDDLLFPHLSVGENLAFGLTPAVRGSRERRKRVDGALQSANLSGFAGRDPATLSGGQRARVALMRTLLSEPEALLLDEPFSKLDEGLRAEVRSFVFDHVKANGLPVLMVTHDQADADAAAGGVIHL